MITACELCTKITIEKALREEKLRAEKAYAAKIFAEEIIQPILTELAEIPDQLMIGCKYSHWSSPELYRKLSEWKNSLTSCGNPKKERKVIDEIYNKNLDWNKLDYEILNQYLAEFGYKIFWEKNKKTVMTKYSYSSDMEYEIDFLYLSMICPLED